MKRKLIILPILISLLSSIVYAKNLLDSLFKPFFGWDIRATYERASVFIDFILYIFIFLYISRYAIGKRFEGQTAKALAVVISIVLTIGMSVFSTKMGFRLGDLGPLSALILFAILGIIAYNTLKGFGAGTPSAGAFAFLLVYYTLKLSIPGFFTTFENLGDGIIGGILAIGVVSAIVVAVIGLISGIKGSFTGTPEGEVFGKGWDLAKKGGKKGKDWYDKKKEDKKKLEDEEKKLSEEIADINLNIKRMEKSLVDFHNDENYKQSEIESKYQQINSLNNFLKQFESQMDGIQKRLDEIKAGDKFGNSEEVRQLETNLSNLRNQYNQYMLKIGEEIEKLEKIILNIISEDDRIIRELNQYYEALGDKNNKLTKSMNKLHMEYKLVSKQYKEAGEKGNMEDMHNLRQRLIEIQQEIGKLREEIDESEQNRINEEIEEQKRKEAIERKEIKLIGEIKDIVNEMNNFYPKLNIKNTKHNNLMKNKIKFFEEKLKELFNTEAENKATRKKIKYLHAEIDRTDIKDKEGRNKLKDFMNRKYIMPKEK